MHWKRRRKEFFGAIFLFIYLSLYLSTSSSPPLPSDARPTGRCPCFYAPSQTSMRTVCIFPRSMAQDLTYTLITRSCPTSLSREHTLPMSQGQLLCKSPPHPQTSMHTVCISPRSIAQDLTYTLITRSSLASLSVASTHSRCPRGSLLGTLPFPSKVRSTWHCDT